MIINQRPTRGMRLSYRSHIYSPALIAEDIDQTLVHPIREPGVFLSTKPGKHNRQYEGLLKRMTQSRKTHAIQRPIRSNRAPLIQVPHLRHNRRNTTRAQARRPPSDQTRKGAEELPFRERGLQPEEVREDADDHEELVRGVTKGGGAGGWEGERRGTEKKSSS